MLGRRPPRRLPARIDPRGPRAVLAVCADSDEPVQAAVFEAIRGDAPDAVLFAGDASYAGASDRHRRASLRRWRRDWGPLADRVYAVPGNHDFDSPRGLATWREAVPAVEGVPDDLAGLAFALRVGPVAVVAVTAPDARKVPERQLHWLAETLAACDAPHRIALFHEPAWPIGRRMGQSLDVQPGSRDRLWQVLERAGVSLVLNGHDHSYARRTIDRERPIVQVTTGGAGAALYADRHGEADVFVPTFHRVLLTADADAIALRALALDGRLLDELEIPAVPSPFAGPPVPGTTPAGSGGAAAGL